MSVEGVTGIGARQSLKLLRAPGFPLTVTKLGQLKLVDRVSRWPLH